MPKDMYSKRKSNNHWGQPKNIEINYRNHNKEKSYFS